MDAKPHVLLVDDEPRILRSLRMLLKPHFTVYTADSGIEALSVLEHEQIDVLLCDQRMPVMTGAEVLREATQRSPHTMRILLTGYSDLNDIINSINEGEIFRFVNKPWDAEELKQTVAKAAAIARESAPAHDAAANIAAPELERVPHLLVLDTDSSTEHLVRELVGDRARIRASHSLPEALKLLADENIAVLVSELRLGHKDLSPMLRALKRYSPSTLSLIVTSFQDNSALIDLINQARIHRLLPKPLSKTLLERGLLGALEHHAALQRSPALTARHTVETPAGESGREAGLLGGFIQRLRRRLGSPRSEAAEIGG
jgi:response regulator RpfG family c-di-GMP phosphodiesterase